MTVWKVLQGLVLVGFLATIALLPISPPIWVERFWAGAIAILPLVFLISPALWRNVCPLATLGSGGPVGPEPGQLRQRGLPPVLPGVIAILALIPLRAVLFQPSGLGTSGLLASIGVVAFWQGRKAPRKSGFCNRLCPVLPMERLYGQSPLVMVENPRCDSCDLCGPRGCIDLNSRSAIPQILGASRRNHAWLLSPLGVLAGALPGVIWAFAHLPISRTFSVEALLGATATLVWWGGSSWIAAGVVVRAFKASWNLALPTLAAISAALQLWLSIPGALSAWGAPIGPTVLQAMAMAAVGAWWVRAQSRARGGKLVQLAAQSSTRR